MSISLEANTAFNYLYPSKEKRANPALYCMSAFAAGYLSILTSVLVQMQQFIGTRKHTRSDADTGKHSQSKSIHESITSDCRGSVVHKTNPYQQRFTKGRKFQPFDLTMGTSLSG